MTPFVKQQEGRKEKDVTGSTVSKLQGVGQSFNKAFFPVRSFTT